jgi:hypothetical protein
MIDMVKCSADFAEQSQTVTCRVYCVSGICTHALLPAYSSVAGLRYSYSWKFWGRIKDQEEALKQAEAMLKMAAVMVLRDL